MPFLTDQVVENANNLIGRQFSEIYRKFLVAVSKRGYFGWINRFHSDMHPYHRAESRGTSLFRAFGHETQGIGVMQGQALSVLVFFFSRVPEVVA
ncbi:MAG: hypothetical protein KZQ99_11910 [Candidatus Thiodiazotropha sp. (ex Dulcina madagascariensis)]|nr:hypothetical protein [Candidatus Thiodiazotropha sp. (ex Dulcina madagascariensis)]